MNTEIDYLYRDASNYKKPNRVIVKGVLTDQQKQDIFRNMKRRSIFGHK